MQIIESAEEFRSLAESDDEDARWLSTHGEASMEVWLQAVANYPHLRHWIAHNKTVPLEILAVLARDRRSEVRQWVAMRRKLSRDLFELLAQDRSVLVRMSIARNAKAPQELLAQLASDRSADVRQAAVENLAKKM